jgi:hypothetical protein
MMQFVLGFITAILWPSSPVVRSSRAGCLMARPRSPTQPYALSGMTQRAHGTAAPFP